MAIGTPVSRGTAGGTTTATVASFTPAAGDTLIAGITCRKNSSAPAAIVLTDSLGGHWDPIDDEVYDVGSNPRVRIALYQQVATGAAMTVTATVSDAASLGLGVASASGVGTDFSNFVLNTNLSGDPSCTLPNAPAATSVVFGFCMASATNAITQMAGTTELFEFTANSNMRVEAAYDAGSPAQTFSWSSVNTLSIGLAVELKEPASDAKSGTGTVSASSSLSSAGGKATSGTGAAAATSALTSTGKKADSGTGSIGAASAVSGQGGKRAQGSGSLSSTTGITSNGAKHAGATVALTASLGLSTTGSKSASGTGGIAATADLSADGFADNAGEHHSGAGSVSVTTGISSSGSRAGAGNGAISCATAANANGSKAARGIASLSGTGAISSAGVKASSGSTVLAVSVAMSATGTSGEVSQGARIAFAVAAQREVSAVGVSDQTITGAAEAQQRVSISAARR